MSGYGATIAGLDRVPDTDILGSPEQRERFGGKVDGFRREFREAIADSKVVDIDRLRHAIVDPVKSIEGQIAQAVGERSEGKLCLSPNYQWLQGSGFTNFHAIRTSGPKTSVHGVFFGVLHADPEDATEGIAVAVKPCLERSDTAYRDWIGNTLARAMHDDRSYEPIGFLENGHRGYSLTRLKKEAYDALDKTSWTNAFLYKDMPEYEYQRNTVRSIGAAMAALHRKHIYHGDPQFKNIILENVITSEVNQVYFIDWESSTFYQQAPDLKTMLNGMEHDLRVLYASMARSVSDSGVGLLDRLATHAQWSLFREYVLGPYIETYISIDEDSVSSLDAVGEVEERIKNYILDNTLKDSLARVRRGRKE